LPDKIGAPQLRRNASQYRPPAMPRPPPITMISGSSTFTRNAALTPNAWPAEINISIASLSPFDAARKTSSAAEIFSDFLTCAKRFAIAGPEANSSSTGRNFAPQWVQTVLRGLLDNVIALP